MFKPLTSKLGPSNGLQTGEIPLELLTRTFGATYPVNEPLRETELPIQHVELDDDLPIDTRAKRPDPKPSISSIANARLLSIQPRTPERKQQVMEMIGTMLEPLKILDEFIATLEAEHFSAIDDRWERTRQQGRELSESMDSLLAKYATAMNYSNTAEQTRGQRRGDFAQRVEERRRVSTWASEKEIEAADQKVEKARTAMETATAKALERQQELASAESRVASAKENVRLFQLEMKRCEAELKGIPYFDPNLGLSTDPAAHRNSW